MKTFLAVYMGGAPEAGRAEPGSDDIARGMAAWGQWMQDHADKVIDQGGPLGKTKEVSAKGVADISNLLTGYVTLKAESHEDAARLFLNHPHFAIFPGHSVEIMEIMPIPTV